MALFGKLAKNIVKKAGGGGLSDLLDKFDNKKTDSWVSTGRNEPLTADEVKAAMPASELESWARDADVTVDEAANQLAEAIPEAVNELTPEGQLPDEASLNDMVHAIVGEEAPPASEELQVYTVQSGDSLSAIAQRVYGNAGDYMRIFEANRDKLNDPNLIHPGQELTIPR